MNNILIVVFGVIFVVLGFYSMSFGFSTPPNITFFFVGLILTVFGGMAVIIYGSPQDFKSLSNDGKASGTKSSRDVKPQKSKVRKAPQKIRPVATKKRQDPSIKKLVTDKKDEIEKKDLPKEIKPKRNPNKTVSSSKDEVSAGKDKIKAVSKEIKPVSAQKTVLDNKNKQKEIGPVSDEGDRPKKLSERVKSPFTRKKSSKKDKQKIPVVRKMDSMSEEKGDEFVKNRLSRLKENTLKNAKDIENLIEERLDSFKGSLDHIKPESKDPTIIWSFDAGDVQKSMKDTISKAGEKILMMYPWIRNVDVSVLKRFMETDSRMILQEASLDDDASVELIKLLMDNKVKIRTMPYVHTIAIVSDEDNGLIISTDPIYESYEVGVIYRDQKSVEEIERMFDEAWNLSQEINLS